MSDIIDDKTRNAVIGMILGESKEKPVSNHTINSGRTATEDQADNTKLEETKKISQQSSDPPSWKTALQETLENRVEKSEEEDIQEEAQRNHVIEKCDLGLISRLGL